MARVSTKAVCNFFFQTAQQLWDTYISRVRSSEYKHPNPFASFGYDAAWTCALTLNASIEALKERKMKLEDFSYNNTRMRNVFTDIMGRVNFHGMSVSAAKLSTFPNCS